MPLIIQDTWLEYLPSGARGVPDATISLVPTQTPVFLRSGLSYQLLASHAEGAATDSSGSWMLRCPWPSETPLNPNLQWQLVLPDRSVYQGAAPEGVSGPLSVGQLTSPPYNWLLVAAGQAATTASVTYLPDLGFIEGQVLFPGFTGGAETITTTFNADGSIVTAYAQLGLAVTLAVRADGAIVETYGPPINRSKTTTFSGQTIVEAIQ
jgi:hypothetical protein